MFKGVRSSALVALLVLVAGLAIAACGSSSSKSSASASAAGGSSTASSGTTTTGGRRGFADLTATQRSCLKSKGVSLPTGGGFGRGSGTFTRPSGSGTFTRPAGATPPGGTSTTGGFFGGGAGGGPRSGDASKFAAAFKACGVSFGGGFRGAAGAGAGAGGQAKVSSTAIKAFVACVDKHGYKVTGVNTSGKGDVLPASLRTNQKFLAAAKDCTSLLRPSGSPGGTGTPSSS